MTVTPVGHSERRWMCHKRQIFFRTSGDSTNMASLGVSPEILLLDWGMSSQWTKPNPVGGPSTPYPVVLHYVYLPSSFSSCFLNTLLELVPKLWETHLLTTASPETSLCFSQGHPMDSAPVFYSHHQDCCSNKLIFFFKTDIDGPLKQDLKALEIEI